MKGEALDADLGYRWHSDPDCGRILLVWKCEQCDMNLKHDADGIIECVAHGAKHVRQVEVCRACRSVGSLPYTLKGWQVCESCFLKALEAARRAGMLMRDGKRVKRRVRAEDLRKARSA